MVYRNFFALALFLTASLLSDVAQAGFMPNFTGFTQMSDSPSATDVVNFAAYQNTTGNWATALGVAPSPGADTAAQYVYFYEVVNNGGAASKIGDFNVNSYDLPYTSSGFLHATVFSDGAPVGPAGNQYLGPNPPGMPPDDPSNSNPTASGFAAPAFVPSAAAVDPLGSNPGGLANGDFASFFFLTPGFAQSLTSGLYSSVLYLTSNISPTYSEGQVANLTGGSSDGGIPTQAPEPTSLAIWGLGMLGLAIVGRQRWKHRQLVG